VEAKGADKILEMKEAKGELKLEDMSHPTNNTIGHEPSYKQHDKT
jgi:hypothetical protein